jgi:hypothetical protein
MLVLAITLVMCEIGLRVLMASPVGAFFGQSRWLPMSSWEQGAILTTPITMRGATAIHRPSPRPMS